MPPVSRGPAGHLRRRVGERLAARLLDGPHVWGAVEVWSSRYGFTTCCLSVYPPGATRRDRARFRAMRAWPPLGILLVAAVLIGVGHSFPQVAAIALAAAAYCSGALGAALVAGPSRRLIRKVQWQREEVAGAGSNRDRQDRLDGLAVRLVEAERCWRAGLIDAVRFELVWGEVWRELGDTSTGRS